MAGFLYGIVWHYLQTRTTEETGALNFIFLQEKNGYFGRFSNLLEF